MASALVEILSPATGVMVHERPPEIVNPMAVVIHRPQTVTYSAAGLGVDHAELPVVIVGGIEQEDAIEALKETCRRSVLADQSLGLVVAAAYPSEERNWRNYTGAGGIQLLQVELILTIEM